MSKQNNSVTLESMYVPTATAVVVIIMCNAADLLHYCSRRLGTSVALVSAIVWLVVLTACQSAGRQAGTDWR